MVLKQMKMVYGCDKGVVLYAELCLVFWDSVDESICETKTKGLILQC
jgi:hypothetical protein